MEGLDFWRLCDELSIIQAALLLAGRDPGGGDGYVENWDRDKRPIGYEAAKTAITNALRRGSINGELIPLYEYDINGNQCGVINDSVDIEDSRIEVESLRQWLVSRGIRTGFFFPLVSDSPDYLDPNHQRYAPKLAAAVKVWLAMEDENLMRGMAVKDAMSDWLTSRYKELGLVWDGAINNTGINEAVKVANWKPTGGATKTPGE